MSDVGARSSCASCAPTGRGTKMEHVFQKHTQRAGQEWVIGTDLLYAETEPLFGDLVATLVFICRQRQAL